MIKLTKVQVEGIVNNTFKNVALFEATRKSIQVMAREIILNKAKGIDVGGMDVDSRTKSEIMEGSMMIGDAYENVLSGLLNLRFAMEDDAREWYKLWFLGELKGDENAERRAKLERMFEAKEPEIETETFSFAMPSNNTKN